MGSALAARLAQKYDLVVTDLDRGAVDRLVALGARAADGPGALAGLPLVITCLPSSAEVEQVLFAPGGLLEPEAPGTVVVDMTSGDPLRTRAMADRARDRGAELVDAPVSGGVIGAREGTIAIMVGASDELFLRLKPLLVAISPKVFHAGDCGAGHAMKAINNMVSSCARIATFEGLVLAAKAGIAPARYAEILASGSGRGYVADTTLPRYVLADRADQGFGLALMYKDLVLATRLGEALGARLSAGELARDTFLRALNELGDDVDITQLVRIFEREAGVDVCVAEPN
jgi:3-hydroxyisobutyrate dehydrogenase